MLKKLSTFLLALLTCVGTMVGSVATNLPYTCGFEEGEDLSAWTLNEGSSSATDQWIFGTAVHRDGQRSLFVTADGTNPTYGKGPNVVVSILRYKFPTSTTTQKYDVSFDWKGTGDSATSKLYLLFCREMDLTTPGATNLQSILNSPNAQLVRPTIQACQSLGESGEKFVCGSERWQNVSLSHEISVSAVNSQWNFVFVFIWVNSLQQDTVLYSSIAIDNFQIHSPGIGRPTNLDVLPQCEDSSLLVTWKAGVASVFDIQYRKSGEPEWGYGRNGISAGTEGFSQEGNAYSYKIKPVPEGSYDVRIRSVYYDDETSQTLLSNYVSQSLILVYCPDNHCINYTNMDDPDIVYTIGYFPNFKNNNETPYDDTIKVDYGPDAIGSRHTLHVDPDEVDPRTDNMLHTVPEGSLASVRLGNWEVNGEAESVTYTIHVDSFSQGILLIKYAIVFEDPAHGSEDQQFKIEILKSDGTLIDSPCGQISHTCSSASLSMNWHIAQDNYGVNIWKDWSTIGINLMDYHDQDIKVRFTNMDCGMGGHFGYAYFTIDCINAHFMTENYNSDASVTLEAPKGFSYVWYKDNNITDIVGTGRTLTVDNLNSKYTCRVSSMEEQGCWFEMNTVSDINPTAINNTHSRSWEDQGNTRKVLIDNHIHILRGNKTYTLTGQEVR